MKEGRCKDCHKIKLLTRHSEKGFPYPFVYICRDCHDKRHHIKQHKPKNKKYKRGTPRQHKRK